MSLVNEYLKRLGGSLSQRGPGNGIPPSLQRRRRGEVKSSSKPGRPYFRFGIIVVAVYTIGYLLLNLVTLLQAPAVDDIIGQPVAVEEGAQSTAAAPAVATSYRSERSAGHAGRPSGDGGERRTVIDEKQQIDRDTLPDKPGAVQKIARTGVENTANKIENEDLPGKQVSGIAADRKGGPADGAGVKKAVSTDPIKVRNGAQGTDRRQDKPKGVVDEPYPIDYDAGTIAGPGDEDGKGIVIFTPSENKIAYFYQIALQAQHNRNYRRAEQYYKLVLQKEPDDENTLVNLCAIYIEEQRFDAAEKLIKRVLTNNKENAKALVNAGMIALRKNDLKKAKSWFEQAVRHNPVEEAALVNLAYLAQKEKNFTAAADYYEKLIRLDADNINILLAYAGLKEQLHQYKQALALYRKSVRQMGGLRHNDRYNNVLKRIQLLRQYVSQQEMVNRMK